MIVGSLQIPPHSDKRLGYRRAAYSVLLSDDGVSEVLFYPRFHLIKHVVVDSVVALPHDCLFEHPGLAAAATAETSYFPDALSLALFLLARCFGHLVSLGFDNIHRDPTEIFKNPFRHP